jgi:hypothetical protein
MSRRETVMVSRTLYQIGVATLLAALTWVAVSAYSALNNTSVVEIDKSVLTPINLGIDLKVIESLSQRLVIQEQLAPPEVLEITVATESASVIQDDTIVVDTEDELTN